MRITVRGEAFDVDPRKLSFGEAKRIESVTGLTFSKWGEQLTAGSVTALQALVWTMMRRSRPDIRFDDIDDIEFGDLEMGGDDTDDSAPPGATSAGPAVDPTPTE